MFQTGFFKISSWFNYFWWFYNEIDRLTIKRIWNTIETTLFYYSEKMATAHVCKWRSNYSHIRCKRVIDNKTVRRQVISICLHLFSEWKQTPFNELLWLLHVWNSTVVCLAHWKVIFISRAWPKGQKQQWSKQSQARTLSVQTSMENTWCFSAEL